jgi:hypothetical protein
MAPPPLTCPHPESSAPDCPLYDQRVSLADSEAIRRLVLTERQGGPNLATLIEGERPTVAEGACLPVLPVPHPEFTTPQRTSLIKRGHPHA